VRTHLPASSYSRGPPSVGSRFNQFCRKEISPLTPPLALFPCLCTRRATAFPREQQPALHLSQCFSFNSALQKRFLPLPIRWMPSRLPNRGTIPARFSEFIAQSPLGSTCIAHLRPRVPLPALTETYSMRDVLVLPFSRVARLFPLGRTFRAIYLNPKLFFSKHIQRPSFSLNRVLRCDPPWERAAKSCDE